MPEQKMTEDEFRGALKDVAAMARKLAPYCASVEDLVGLIDLAQDNDAQLKILMALVYGTPPQGKR